MDRFRCAIIRLLGVVDVQRWVESVITAEKMVMRLRDSIDVLSDSIDVLSDRLREHTHPSAEQPSAPDVLAVPCPTCEAGAGERCVGAAGQPRTRVHGARRAEAKTAG